jgi:hypothetical protein
MIETFEQAAAFVAVFMAEFDSSLIQKEHSWHGHEWEGPLDLLGRSWWVEGPRYGDGVVTSTTRDGGRLIVRVGRTSWSIHVTEPSRSMSFQGRLH